jgi:squalene cyclase
MAYDEIGRYPECSSSVLQALMLFKELNSSYRTKEIETCIKNSTKFIESTQEEDGSWFVIVLCY